MLVLNLSCSLLLIEVASTENEITAECGKKCSDSVYFLPVSPLSQCSKKYTHDKVIGLMSLFCLTTASDWTKIFISQ